MKINVKKKLNAIVNHVKSHPALYGYLAGGVVVGIAITVVQEKHITNFLKNNKIIDLNTALDRILEDGLNGLYYPMDEDKLLLLTIKSTKDFIEL